MCGIVCAFDLKEKSGDLRPKILEMSKRIRHRGPDWSGIFNNNNAIWSQKISKPKEFSDWNLFEELITK